MRAGVVALQCDYGTYGRCTPINPCGTRWVPGFLPMTIGAEFGGASVATCAARHRRTKQTLLTARWVGRGGAYGARVAAEFADADDRQLLQSHLRGDREAFGQLARRHRNRLWAVALRTLGNPEDAADALQDALLSAYRRANSFRGEAAVTTWLHRIVVNACLDLVRRRAVRPVVPLPAEAADLGLGAAQVGRDAIGERQLQLDITAALRLLPFDQRVAIVLVDIEGYSVAEASRILDVPSGTVKSRCARGRARLADELSAYGNRPDEDDVPSETSTPDGCLPDPGSRRDVVPEGGFRRD